MTIMHSREYGLQLAIDVAGSITGLARLVGVTQASVSGWKRVPAQRVIQIEALTCVHRRVLRPDLYDVPEAPLSIWFPKEAEPAAKEDFPASSI